MTKAKQLMLVAALLAGTTAYAQYPDLPSNGNTYNLQTLPAGSYVIAMDNFNQNNGTADNESANATFANGSTTGTLSAANPALYVGMSVTGNNIPAGTKLTAISGTSITISNATTATISNKSLTFGGFIFNLKAYGLITTLLNNGKKLRWVIKPGKAKDAYDFSVAATQQLPTAGTSATFNFAAGPFVIFQQDTAGVAALVNTYNASMSTAQKVKIYRTDANVTVDVRYDYVMNGKVWKPKVAVLNDGNNSSIHVTYMTNASIPTANYQVKNASDLITGCYTFASEPHNDNATSATILSIRNFVTTGGNFLAECAAVPLYEADANGHFQSTSSSGFAQTNGTPATWTYSNSDLAYFQINGYFGINDEGGSCKNWNLSNPANGAHVYISGAVSGVSYTNASVSKMVASTVRGGMVSYLGSHSYNGSTNYDINGQRLYLNAMLVPNYITTCSSNTTYGVNDENSTWLNIAVSGNVLTNDFDPEGNTQTVSSFMQQNLSGNLASGSTVSGTNKSGNTVSNAGTLVYTASGTYTFAPATGFTGTVRVPYNVCDNGAPQACAVAYLDITVDSNANAGTNNVIANNDENISYGTAVTGNLLTNDRDPQGDAFSATAVSFGTVGTSTTISGKDNSGNSVSNAGTLVVGSNGNYTYTPASGFVGTVDVSYTITDANGATSTAHLDIMVLTDANGLSNDPPFPGDDFGYTTVNTVMNGNFINNDKDPNGDPLSVQGITIVTGSAHTAIGSPVTTQKGGAVQLYADGTYSYTPPSNYSGPDLVTYETCDVTNVDPHPLCADASIHLLVNNTVASPLAVTLTSFTAMRKNSNVVLYWQTAMEQNNRGFAVERNTGSDWEQVAFVPSHAANGNSSVQINYEYTDVNYTSGVSQYRIKELAWDGKYVYSQTRIVLGTTQVTDVVIYPNPATNGKINIQFHGEHNGHVDVIDMNGRLVKQLKNITDDNVTIDGLATGVYVLRILTSDSEPVIEKVVVR